MTGPQTSFPPLQITSDLRFCPQLVFLQVRVRDVHCNPLLYVLLRFLDWHGMFLLIRSLRMGLTGVV